MNASNILALMGGLGLFLLGMNQMSDGIEKAAGAKLRICAGISCRCAETV